MRKLLLTLSLGILLSTNAWATTHYFAQGSPDNTLPCTEADPCDNFAGTTLDNLNAMSCGDVVALKRGNEWVGAEAEVRPRITECTASNPLIIGAYGTGADPILAGAAVTTSGYSVHSGNIYKITQSQTNLWTVTQDDNKALMYYGGSNTTLPEGSFKREGTTLYLRLWNNANPSTSSVRIGNYVGGEYSDGERGILSTDDTYTEAHYVYFRDIHVIGVNGKSVTVTGTGNRTLNLTITGGAKDQWLAYYNSSFGGRAQDWGDYYGEYRYGVTYHRFAGDGVGQSFTAYGGPKGFAVGTWVYRGGMAGLDLLDFGSTSNVTQVYFLRTFTHNNGQALADPSYDPNIYIDGASEVFLYGNRMHSGGVGTGTAGNARGGLQIGSEHPTSKRVEYVVIVNNLISGINYQAFVTTALCYGTDTTSAATECPPSGATPPNNIRNIQLAYNTFLAYSSNGYVHYLPYIDSTADTFDMRNNIFYGDNGAQVNGFHSSATKWDFDYNVYYRQGGNTDIYGNISACGGGADSNCTLAEWRTASGEDANSVYGDPQFVTDSDTAPDVHIGAGSPAVNLGTTSAYTIPTWLPQTVKDDITTYGIKGSTQATYTEDNVSTAPDAGFHYDYAGITNASVTMTSSVSENVTTATVTFTIPKGVTALIMDDKVKVTFPSGFTLNSGGTSTATASTGISGTFSACTVSGQTITCPRTGDGYSEFPESTTSHSLTISNIKNPTATGTTGTFTIEVLGNIWGVADTRRAWNNAVSGVTISSSGGSTCGNSIIESGETCDDGNTTALDGCSATCQTETPVCGNSIVEYLEQCDDGGTVSLDGCDSSCQIENPVCGNGIIESGETCDDSNTTAGDGCSATCQSESTTGTRFGCSKGSFSKGFVR